jgi:hypothetical protein
MKFFPLFIYILVLLSSCKKGATEFTITGVVSDLTFNQPLKNASIKVLKTSADSGDQSYVTTINTDSEGNYSFTIPRDRFVSFDMIIEKDGYFSIEQKVNFNQLTVKEKNIINLNTTGKSWVKIHLIHTANSNTKMDIIRTKGKSSCLECCPNGYQQFKGIIDTVFYCTNDANTEYEFTYLQQQSTISGTKNAITPFMDTVELLLQY